MTNVEGKLIRGELLNIGRSLSLEQIIWRSADTLYRTLNNGAAFLLLRWEPKKPVVLYQENGNLSGNYSLVDIARKLTNRNDRILITAEEAAQGVGEELDLPPGWNLAYFPLTDTLDLRAALTILTQPPLVTPGLLEEVETVVVAIKNATENAAEYSRLMREYSILEMARKTWEQLWREIEGQQKAIERLLARNQALYDIGLAINSSLDLKDVLATIVVETVKLMQVSRGAIAL